MFFTGTQYQILSGWRSALAVVVIALSLSGCGLMKAIFKSGGGNEGDKSVAPKPPLKIRSVTLVMDEAANDNWPVAVEMVRVRDANLIKELLAIDSKEWFAKESEAFRAANPNAYFDKWEVVPGTAIEFAKVKRMSGRVGGVLFCDLVGSKPAMRINKNGRVFIKIGPDGCEITELRRR